MARCPSKRAGLRQGGEEALRDGSPTDGWGGGRAPASRKGHCGAPCLQLQTWAEGDVSASTWRPRKVT